MKFLKIPEALNFESINYNTILENIKLDDVKQDGKQIINLAFKDIDPNAKTAIYDWAKQVKQIKNESTSNEAQKIEQLHKLKTDETVVFFFEAVLKLIIDKAPMQNKSLLQMGFSTLIGAGSALSLNTGSLAYKAILTALPSLIITKQFDVLLSYVDELDFKNIR